MARPKKAPGRKRTQSLNPRLTVEERARIEAAARLHGLSSSDFMRQRALGYRLPPIRPEVEAMQSLAAALIPIGVNLNQVVRAANAGRLLPARVAELTDRISCLLDDFYGSGHHQRGAEL